MCKTFPITVCYFGNFLYSNLPVTILLRVSAINFLILILFSRFNFDFFSLAIFFFVFFALFLFRSWFGLHSIFFLKYRRSMAFTVLNENAKDSIRVRFPFISFSFSFCSRIHWHTTHHHSCSCLFSFRFLETVSRARILSLLFFPLNLNVIEFHGCQYLIKCFPIR